MLVAALVCAIVVVRNIFGEAHHVIGWAVAASVVAMLLTPVVQLMNRRMPRALAILLTFVMIGALGAGTTWLYTSSVLDQVSQIQDSGPSIAEGIEQRDDRLGELATEVGLADQVAELTDRLSERTGTQGDALKSVAFSLPPYFVSMILTIFLLIFGPQMIDGAIDQLGPQRRERLRPALVEAANRTQRYAWASILQGVVNGLAVWLVGSMLDVPAITLLAMFAAVVAMLPYMGIFIGWVPMLLLAFGVAPEGQVAAALLVPIALQVVEATWWRPTIDHRSLHVGPAVPVIVAILGFGVYGIGGALYGCAIAVFGLALLDQLDPGDGDLPTPIDEPATGDG